MLSLRIVCFSICNTVMTKMRKIVILIESFDSVTDEPIFEVRRGLLVTENFAIYINRETEDMTVLSEVKPTDGEDVYESESVIYIGHSQVKDETDDEYLRRIVRKMKRMSTFEFFTTCMTRNMEQYVFGQRLYDIASDKVNADTDGNR